MALIDTKYSKTKKYDKPLYPNPTHLQDIFCVSEINNSGIFKLNQGRYSKSFLLTDINFNGLTNREQESIIENFSRILDSMTCRFSFTVANEYKGSEDLISNLLYEYADDGKDLFRDAFNELIRNSVTSARQGLYKSIYLTLTIEADSFANATTTFSTLESSLRTAFTHIGVNAMTGAYLIPLSTNERMQILYNFSHFGLHSDYKFNFSREQANYKNWRNIVAPVSFKKHNTSFEMNGCYGAVYYIDTWANELCSDLISALSEINCTSYITINSEILNSTSLKEEMKRKHSKIGFQIENEKQNNRNKNDFLSDASDILLSAQDSLNKFSKQVSSNDNRYFNTTIFFMFLTETYKDFLSVQQEMDSITSIRGFKMEPCFNMQIEGINSAFLFGAQEFKRVCNLSSICQAMFIMFKSQEINDKDGRYLGINQISQNVIRGNRKGLSNKAGLYLGMSRHGKSVFAKCEILNAVLSDKDDQILIIDPQGEYKGIVNKMGGTVVSFSALKELYVNPLDVDFSDVDYSTLQEIIGEKTDFIFTLLSSCMRKDLTSEEQGVLDRVIDRMYNENFAMRNKCFNDHTNLFYDFETPAYMEGKEMELSMDLNMPNEEQIRKFSPTLQDVYQRLLDYDSENSSVAKKLANNMDVFVNGSLNLFNHFTNVDLNNKLICFDLSNIKENLRNTAMLIMIEIIRSKIKDNWKQGFWSYLFIDEFHELLGIDKVCDYVVKLWKEVGKMKGIVTGITQNMTDLINHSANSDKLKAIISNTAYFALFNQSTLDRNMLMEFLPSVSPAMFNYVEGAMPGMGLLIFGNNTIPFDFRIDKDSLLYDMVNTDGNVTKEGKKL